MGSSSPDGGSGIRSVIVSDPSIQIPHVKKSAATCGQAAKSQAPKTPRTDTILPECLLAHTLNYLLCLLTLLHLVLLSQKDKKVINSSTKCLISVKIAILTPHIIPPPLVNVWLIFDLQKYVNWLCVILEVNPCFQKAHVFCMDLHYSQLQIYTMLYVL